MTTFSRREREIMDALYAAGESDVEDIRARMQEPPGYDSVRTILRILESKGHVQRRTDGRRHVYRPVQNRAAALKGAWRNLVQTFFQGSYEAAAATLLSTSDKDLDTGKLARMLEDAKQRKAGKRR